MNGSLNNLPERGDLYEPKYNKNVASSSKQKIEWDEKLVEVQEETPRFKNKFQADLENEEDPSKILTKQYDFENEVKVWSDFLYTRFHPRTVNIVKQYQHCNENTPFDAFPLGVDLWKSEEFINDFCDKIRNYVEECDYFQVSKCDDVVAHNC